MMLYTAQNINRPSQTGLGANPFTGAQYIINQGPVAPPFAIPTMVDGKATGFTQPSAEAFQEAIDWSQPVTGAQDLWAEYIQNAYHGNLPSRLKEVDAAIRSGEGLSDHMVNRIMYEDAMWGGSIQDVPTSAVLESRGEYPGGNPLAYSGGPGSGNAERLWEDQLGADVYQAPIQTAPAQTYGLLTSIGQNLGRASDRGVPTAAIQQAADFDAGLQAARYEQGDLPTDTGPGLFTLPLYFTGPFGVFAAGATNSIANDNPFGVLTTTLGTAIADGANFSFDSPGFENPDALYFGRDAATNLYRPESLAGLDAAPIAAGFPGSPEYFNLFGDITTNNLLPLNLPYYNSLPLTDWEAMSLEQQQLASNLWGGREGFEAAAESLYEPESLGGPKREVGTPGLLSGGRLSESGETQSAGVAPIINVGGPTPGYVPPPPPPPPDLPVYFDYEQNPFATRALGGF